MKKLSLKRKKFCIEMVNTQNQTEAAFRSFNVKSRESAAVLGNKAMRDPLVQKEIERLLEAKDVTEDLLITRLREGLDANVVANYKGEATLTDIPDQDVRFKFFEAGAKIKNLFPAQRIDSRSINIDVQLEQMSKAELSELLSNSLKELNDNRKGGEVIHTEEIK